MGLALLLAVTGQANKSIGTAKQLKVAWGVPGKAGQRCGRAGVTNANSNLRAVAVAITVIAPTGQSFSGLPGRAKKLPTVSSQTVRGNYARLASRT